MEEKQTFESTFERVKRVTGWKKQQELTDFLGISSSAITGPKKRNAFPLEWAFKIAQAFETSTDWILTGKGLMRLGENVGQIVQLEDPTITELKSWLNELRGEEPGIYVWFRVELQKKFPDYKEWLDKKRTTDSFEISGTG